MRDKTKGVQTVAGAEYKQQCLDLGVAGVGAGGEAGGTARRGAEDQAPGALSAWLCLQNHPLCLQYPSPAVPGLGSHGRTHTVHRVSWYPLLPVISSHSVILTPSLSESPWLWPCSLPGDSTQA